MGSSSVGPQPLTGGISERLVRNQLARILASEMFSRSERLGAFLQFVVDEALAGRGSTLKESVLAARLYTKGPDGPDRDHSVVRVDARRVRDKLREFYAQFHREPLTISLPKGSYSPTFEMAAAAVPEELPPKGHLPRTRRRLTLVAGALAATFLASVVGYQFVSRRGRTTQPAGVATIAVLPFQDLTASRDKQYLCDGITEELTVRLADLAGVRISSRASVSKYRNAQVDVIAAGKELKVQAMLEGSVRVDGGRVRVISKLSNTRDGFHLWTHTYERDTDAVSDIQKEVADAIFKSFRQELKTTRRALVRPPSGSTEAWHHYIRAAYISGREPLKAVEHFHAAVTADSRYALAWAGLSLAATLAVDWGEGDPADLFPRAIDAARRAMALEPSLPEAHQAIARVKVFAEHDWAGAEQAFRRAIELDPLYLDARLHYPVLVLIPNRRFQDAVEELRRGLALFPDNNQLLNQLASAYIKARQFDPAIPLLETSDRIQPLQLATRVYRGMIASGSGNHRQALVHFEEAASLKRTPWALSHLGYTLARLGRQDQARAIIRELDQAPAGKTTYDYEKAAIYAALNERDSAFAHLNSAVAKRDQGPVWLKVDYLFDDLRSDPRFGSLLRAMRLE